MLVKAHILAYHVQIALMTVYVCWRGDFHAVLQLTCQQALAEFPEHIFDHLRHLILFVEENNATFGMALIKTPLRVLQAIFYHYLR